MNWIGPRPRDETEVNQLDGRADQYLANKPGIFFLHSEHSDVADIEYMMQRTFVSDTKMIGEACLSFFLRKKED
jgi:lipopolysaccharide/colanic/teichoic acid biosynthesis glycosyltransferase